MNECEEALVWSYLPCHWPWTETICLRYGAHVSIPIPPTEREKEQIVEHTLISGSTGLLDPSRRRLRQLGKANEHSVAEEQVRYRAWRLRVSERTSSE